MDTQTQTGSPNPIGRVLQLATDRQFKCPESSFRPLVRITQSPNITSDPMLYSSDGSNTLVRVTLTFVYVILSNRTGLVPTATDADLVKTLPRDRPACALHYGLKPSIYDFVTSMTRWL